MLLVTKETLAGRGKVPSFTSVADLAAQLDLWLHDTAAAHSSREVRLSKVDLSKGTKSVDEALKSYKKRGGLVSGLFLDGCSIVKAPKACTDLVDLAVVNLCRNGLKKFPKKLERLPNLKILDLSYNNIDKAPKNLPAFPLLENLSLCNNHLRVFPFSDVPKMAHLRILDVSVNFLDLTKLKDTEIPIANTTHNIWTQRTPAMVLDRLFIGAIQVTEDQAELKRLGIKHVLSVGPPCSQRFEGVRYLHIAIADFPTEDLLGILPQALVFIDEGMSEAGVVVHCAAGHSRSASVVIAWLISRKRMTFEDAWEALRKRRPCVCPNLGFQQQLQQFGADSGFPSKVPIIAATTTTSTTASASSPPPTSTATAAAPTMASATGGKLSRS
ncbi:Dual specificity protein phosphatase [Pelomyxa schiedti]|nr:Dual specificity protein phosphatase [Pelomyxa schiedti]